MNEIKLGTLKMPINAATKSFAILAKRGAGKTYLGGVMAEEFAKNSVPFVVFDPIDVWWGLKIAANGKDKGLPVVVFGVGPHADIQIDRDMGVEIARAIVKDNVSCIISTFGMPKVAARHLVAEFAEELLTINNTPRMVFIEEAHEYVPQRVMGGATKVFAAVEALVTMGRNQGIGVTMLNQRAATINKDVLTQIDTLLALRSVGPQDRKALQDWVEGHGAEGDFDSFLKSLPTLPTGEGWIWSPEFMGVFEKFKIRKRETFHPDREKIGSTFKMPQLNQTDVQMFVSKFGAHIADTRKKLTKAEKKAAKRREAQNASNSDDGAFGFGSDYVPPAPAESEAIRTMRNSYESQLMVKDAEINRLQAMVRSVQSAVGSIVPTGDSQPLYNPSHRNEQMAQNLPTYEKAVFAPLHAHPGIPFTRSQLATAAKKSYTSSAFLAAVRKLIKLKLIVDNGGDLIYV